MNTPTISLSFRTLAAAQSMAIALAGILWTGGVLIGGYPNEFILWGLGQIAAIWIVSVASLVLFSPGKTRPIAIIGSLWSAASFGRFIAALGASSLLYYVAQFGLRPMLFSFLLAAVFLLIAETKVIAATLAKTSLNTE